MTQSLTSRDRFITGFQAKLHDALASGNKVYTLPYDGKDSNNIINIPTVHLALRRLMNTSYPTAFVETPYRVSRTREMMQGRSARVYSGSETALDETIAQITEEQCPAVVLWRLFPKQQHDALRRLKRTKLNLFIVVVEDDTLKTLPTASDTRTVLPENRVSPEKAAQMRALNPYRLFNYYEGTETVETPELVPASTSRAHCRLCGTIIQPGTTCVRYHQYPRVGRAVRANAMYLHNFDCKQPERVLFVDTIKGYAIVTNEFGEPAERTLLAPTFDAETGQIVHKSLDITPRID